jgi:virginiamycin B lyase
MAALLLIAPWLLQGLQAPVKVTEWKVPWADTRPRDPAYGDAEHVWFVGQTGHYVGLLNPANGEFKRFDLAAGAGPHSVVVGPDGALWYSGNLQAHLGRLDPRTGEIRKYDMPDPAARDPHTMVFDKKGVMWFTVQNGNFIGQFTPSSGRTVLIPSLTARSRPYGIELDSQDRPWVVLFGTNKIATVDTATMKLKEFELPNAAARPRRIGITPDDKIWYVDYARGFLGVLDPKTGQVKEYQTPGGASSRPYAMTVDHRNRLWFVETNPEKNRLVGFDPKDEDFISITAIPSGGGVVRHMVYVDGKKEIWFGTDTGTIGRAQIPD